MTPPKKLLPKNGKILVFPHNYIIIGQRTMQKEVSANRAAFAPTSAIPSVTAPRLSGAVPSTLYAAL